MIVQIAMMISQSTASKKQETDEQESIGKKNFDAKRQCRNGKQSWPHDTKLMAWWALGKVFASATESVRNYQKVIIGTQLRASG